MCQSQKYCQQDSGFGKGLLVGGLLGGALVWLTATRQGQEVRERLVEYGEQLSAQLQERVQEWGSYTREKYLAVADTITDELVKSKKLAKHLKKQLMSELQEKWEDFRLEMLFGQAKAKFLTASEKTLANYEKIVEGVVQDYMVSENWGVSEVAVANKLKKALLKSERYQALQPESVKDEVEEKMIDSK